jgi:hypothetical protein
MSPDIGWIEDIADPDPTQLSEGGPVKPAAKLGAEI